MKWRSKNNKKINTEYTDDNGKKWIQTSTEDLFATKELNDVIKSIEEEKENGEIVLAHINFEKVNKEYYDTVNSLKAELEKKDELIKKLLGKTKALLSRKNKKLTELITHIKKLHFLLSYYNQNPENAEKLYIPPETLVSASKTLKKEAIMEQEEIYIDSEEILLDENGKEIS